MPFDIEFTDSRQVIAVDDIRMSDASGGRADITAAGDSSTVLVWSKFLISQISISGIPVSMVPQQILSKLKNRQLVGIKVRLSNGNVYSGEIGIDSYNEAPKGKGDPSLTATIAGTFSGEKQQDGGIKNPTPRSVGMVVDINQGASYTRGFQDSRMDSAIRPFFIDGIEDTANAIPLGIERVVRELGGYTHTHPYDDTLYVLSASGQKFDKDSVAGSVMYGRGPRDCAPAAPTVTVGYEEIRKRVTQSVDGPDTSGCANVAIVKTIKVKVPTLSIRLPCVWDGTPAQPDFLGKINAGSYSIFGLNFPARELRCDGFDFNPYDSPNGIYSVGTIRFYYREGGWKAGSLTCIFPVQLPLEGNQTQHSYTLNSVFERFYAYDVTDFGELHEICPNCYTNESEPASEADYPL